MKHCVIGGFGTIGREVVANLGAAGEEVTVVQRSAAELPEGVRFVAADVMDLESLDRAIGTVDVVHLLIGLPYSGEAWAAGFPKAVGNALAVARARDARLVYFDNVYMYGRASGPLREDAPYRPITKKGRARAEAAELLLGAIERGEVRALVARSADFYGDYPPLDIVRQFADALKAGRHAPLIGAADKAHSVAFIPDAGAAVARLALEEAAYGQVWHMPTDPQPRTQAQMAGLVAELIGAPLETTVLDRAFFEQAGVEQPVLREQAEMLYQFEEHYVVDSSRIARTFGIEATPLREGFARHLTAIGHELAA